MNACTNMRQANKKSPMDGLFSFPFFSNFDHQSSFMMILIFLLSICYYWNWMITTFSELHELLVSISFLRHKRVVVSIITPWKRLLVSFIQFIRVLTDLQATIFNATLTVKQFFHDDVNFILSICYSWHLDDDNLFWIRINLWSIRILNRWPNASCKRLLHNFS